MEPGRSAVDWDIPCWRGHDLTLVYGVVGELVMFAICEYLLQRRYQKVLYGCLFLFFLDEDCGNI